MTLGERLPRGGKIGILMWGFSKAKQIILPFSYVASFFLSLGVFVNEGFAKPEQPLTIIAKKPDWVFVGNVDIFGAQACTGEYRTGGSINMACGTLVVKPGSKYGAGSKGINCWSTDPASPLVVAFLRGGRMIYWGGNGECIQKERREKVIFPVSSVPTKKRRALVRAVQQALLDRGFDPGPIDGIWGPKSELAVASFQKVNKIDDIIGQIFPPTARALGFDPWFRDDQR